MFLCHLLCSIKRADSLDYNGSIISINCKDDSVENIILLSGSFVISDFVDTETNFRLNGDVVILKSNTIYTNISTYENLFVLSIESKVEQIVNISYVQHCTDIDWNGTLVDNKISIGNRYLYNYDYILSESVSLDENYLLHLKSSNEINMVLDNIGNAMKIVVFDLIKCEEKYVFQNSILDASEYFVIIRRERFYKIVNSSLTFEVLNTNNSYVLSGNFEKEFVVNHSLTLYPGMASHIIVTSEYAEIHDNVHGNNIENNSLNFFISSITIRTKSMVKVKVYTFNLFKDNFIKKSLYFMTTPYLSFGPRITLSNNFNFTPETYIFSKYDDVRDVSFSVVYETEIAVDINICSIIMFNSMKEEKIKTLKLNTSQEYRNSSRFVFACVFPTFLHDVSLFITHSNHVYFSGTFTRFTFPIYDKPVVFYLSNVLFSFLNFEDVYVQYFNSIDNDTFISLNDTRIGHAVNGIGLAKVSPMFVTSKRNYTFTSIRNYGNNISDECNQLDIYIGRRFSWLLDSSGYRNSSVRPNEVLCTWYIPISTSHVSYRATVEGNTHNARVYTFKDMTLYKSNILTSSESWTECESLYIHVSEGSEYSVKQLEASGYSKDEDNSMISGRFVVRNNSICKGKNYPSFTIDDIDLFLIVSSIIVSSFPLIHLYSYLYTYFSKRRAERRRQDVIAAELMESLFADQSESHSALSDANPYDS